MTTSIESVWQYKGTLTQLLGTSLLNAFGPETVARITDADGTLSQADDGLATFQRMTGSEVPLDYVGAGTMSLASIGLFGVTLVSFAPVPVAVFQAEGKIWLLLPEGFPTLLGLNLSSLSASFSISTSANYSLTGIIPCFVSGTGLITPNGRKPVDDIRSGDRVLDCFGTFHPVIWCGSRTVVPKDQSSLDPRNPVCIPANSFGAGVPDRDVHVSQQHRILIQDRGQFVFTKAKFLPPTHARIVAVQGPVSYFHVLTARHAPLLADRLPTESLLPGPSFLRASSPSVCKQIANALMGQSITLDFPQIGRTRTEAILGSNGRSANHANARAGITSTSNEQGPIQRETYP